MNEITILTLGPGKGECLTLAAMAALEGAQKVLLRTDRVPAAEYLRQKGIQYASLDSLYDGAEDFDALNAALADAVLKAAEASALVYAVPDAACDQSVRLLREKHAPLKLLPGVGLFGPLAGLHPEARVTSASELPGLLGDEPLLIVEMDQRLMASEVKLRLLSWFGGSCPCIWYAPSEDVQRTGKTIVLEDLDRQPAYDHTAALYIAPQPLVGKERYTVQDLVRIMAILRAPGGCPWDREQTHQSLRPYLIEEAYEVTQAIRDEDWLHVADELGDVLLQVVFQANIGEQYGTLELSDITTAICSKMIRRHPHIFGNIHAEDAETVTVNWEMIKRQERGQKSLDEALTDIPESLPPLMRAQKALRKAVNAGAAQEGDPAERLTNALHQALSAMDQEREEAFTAFGQLLLACVRYAVSRDYDCETALADATEAYIRRLLQPQARPN